MENAHWLTTLAVGVLSFVGGNGLARVRFSARLRSSISDEVQIAKDMHPSPERDALNRHVARQVRLLIAEEELPTTSERLEKRWGWAFVILGVLAPWQLLGGGWPTAGGDRAFIAVATVAGLGVMGYGIHLITRAARTRERRRWERRVFADSEWPEVPPDPASSE